MKLVNVPAKAVVTERRCLGTIPRSQYVQSKAFVPDRALIDESDPEKVLGDVPVRDERGAPVLQDTVASLDVSRPSLGRAAVISTLTGVMAGGLAGLLKYGLPSPEGMIVGAITGGLSGVALAAASKPSVAFREKAITEPTLAGYTTYSTDSAFVPTRPRTGWPEGGGTQFTFIPTIKDKTIGTMQEAYVAQSVPEWLQGAGPAVLAAGAALLV
ncbi:MAG: hypothetical protein KC910_07705 [Candidatus Eremiobacteraeota bacterium]|nr:hypothetical protein [Candidatus Eremiobacteraeota bacterium]